MMTTTYLILGVVTGLLLVYLLLQMAINRSVKKITPPPKRIPDDSVQCFSCGMVVPVAKALEKKGRYFCGVKRNDRNGNPVVREEGDGENGTLGDN